MSNKQQTIGMQIAGGGCVDYFKFGQTELMGGARVRRTAFSAAISLALTIPVGLAARDALATEAGVSDVAGSATTSGESGSNGLEEIIVTASRHSESLQKESRPISVLTSDDLERNGVSSAQSLNTLVPGLSVANSGDQLQIYVRGVGDRTVTSQTEQAVAFNLDGVYVPRAWESTLTFFDLDRVELLKGPQGTLYGRNASAGALNLLTTAPSFDKFGGYVEAEAGNYDAHRFAGAVNAPINDWIAVRASFQTVYHDGYLTDGNNDADSHAGRIQILVQPNDDFSAKLNVNYMHNGGHGEEPVSLPLVTPKNPWIGASNPITNAQLAASPFAPAPLLSSQYQDVSTWIASLNLEYTFSGMKLTVIPAYVDGHEAQLTYAGGIPTPEETSSKQSSLEIRLSSADAASPTIAGLQWVLGAFGSHEQLSELNLSNEGAGGGDFITAFPKLNDTTGAAFGEAKYSVTRALRIIGGVRYTWERKVAGGSTTSDAPGDFTFPHADTVNFGGVQDFTSTNWRAGLEYDVAPQSMAYFTASTGFKAGGFFAAPAPNTYQPEKLTAYELGIKNRFLDDRLQVNVEGFYWNYNNLQEQFLSAFESGGIGLVTRNAAKATLKGVDLTVGALITNDDKITAEAEYNDAKYKNFAYNTLFFGVPFTGCAATGAPFAATGPDRLDCSGQQLVKAPLWSGSVSYQHTWKLPDQSSFVFAAEEHFSSAYWLTNDFTPHERAPAYNLTNLFLTYKLSRVPLTITAFVDNLANRAVYNYAVQSVSVPTIAVADIGPPRTYGLRLRYEF